MKALQLGGEQRQVQSLRRWGPKACEERADENLLALRRQLDMGDSDIIGIDGNDVDLEEVE